MVKREIKILTKEELRKERKKLKVYQIKHLPKGEEYFKKRRTKR